MPETVNITPTWEALIPIMLDVYESGSEKSRADVKEELLRLARGMDKVNAAGQEGDKSETDKQHS